MTCLHIKIGDPLSSLTPSLDIGGNRPGQIPKEQGEAITLKARSKIKLPSPHSLSRHRLMRWLKLGDTCF